MAPQETSFAHIQNNTHPKWWRDPCLRRNVVHLFGISLCVFYLGCEYWRCPRVPVMLQGAALTLRRPELT